MRQPNHEILSRWLRSSVDHIPPHTHTHTHVVIIECPQTLTTKLTWLHQLHHHDEIHCQMQVATAHLPCISVILTCPLTFPPLPPSPVPLNLWLMLWPNRHRSRATGESDLVTPRLAPGPSSPLFSRNCVQLQTSVPQVPFSLP